MKKYKRPKTIFCDIDGTLIVHPQWGQPGSKNLDQQLTVLPGVVEKLWEWDRLGYNIILTTGRKEGLREITIEQLKKANIIYDQLIMGLGGGERILINDKKPDGQETALAINLQRDVGIKSVEV